MRSVRVASMDDRRAQGQMKRIACVAFGVACVCLSSAACRRSATPDEVVKPSASASSATAEQAPGITAPVAQTGTTTGRGLRRAAACDLITRAEMAEILGASIGKPSADEEKPGTTSCVYPPGDAGSYSQAEVAIEWEHGDAPSFERLLVNAFGGSAVGRQVAHNVHLGDEASYSREGVLSARTGKTLVTITLPMRPDSEEKALAIGKRLFERLGATTAPETAASAPPIGSGGAVAPAPVASVSASGASTSASPNFPDGLSVGEECPEATGDTPDGRVRDGPAQSRAHAVAHMARQRGRLRTRMPDPGDGCHSAVHRRHRELPGRQGPSDHRLEAAALLGRPARFVFLPH